MNKYLILLRTVCLAMLASVSIPAVAGRAFADGTEIYGYSTSGTAGIYALSSDRVELIWQDAGYKSRMYVPLTAGWLNGDKLCGYANDGYDCFYVEYEWTSGAVLTSKSMSSAITYATVNGADGMIYGFGKQSGKAAFYKADPANPTSVTKVCDLADGDYCEGITYNTVENYLVGMRTDCTLVKVNTDGSQEVLYQTGLKKAAEVSRQAVAYSAIDNLYYWSTTDRDYNYLLYTISTEGGGSYEMVDGFPDRQFYFMLSTSEVFNGDAPKAPQLLSLDFEGASPTGKAVIKMPAENESGESLSGDVRWWALVDDSVVTEGSAAPGSVVEILLSDLATGMHSFAFVCGEGEQQSKSTVAQRYVGPDVPVAPANVSLSLTQVSWAAVTAGVHGGYIDAAQIVYTVYVDGEKLAETEALTMPLEGLTEGALRKVSATVTARYGEYVSEAAESNYIVAGYALPLPMLMKPEADDIELCTVIDGDGDGRGWSYNERYGGFFSDYRISEDRLVDDWLILPPVELTEGNTYYFSMEARRTSSMYGDEFLEVRIGKGPSIDEMLPRPVMVEFTPPTAYTEYNAAITAEESGRWYIALHATSMPDQMGMCVRNITLTDNGVSAQSPAAVGNLEVVAAANAVLEATVSFTLPTKTTMGDDLDADAELLATVTGESVATVSGKPGERVEATVETHQGDNRLTVETRLGELNGIRSYIDVYTGVEIPGGITNLSSVILPDMKSVTLTWDAPEAGINGGIIHSDGLTYYIYQLVSNSMVGDYWDKIDEVDAESYTFTTESDRQDTYQLGVAAVNAAGVYPSPVSSLVVLGTPYSLPMQESFDIPQVYTYEPWVIYAPNGDYNTQWGVLPLDVLPFIDDEVPGNTLCGMGLSAGCLGRAGFPVFTTKGETRVVLRAPFWTGRMSTPDLRIIATASDLDGEVEVGSIEANGSWNEMTFELPETLLDRDWVNLFLEASFPEGSRQWVSMDGYYIGTDSGAIDAVMAGVSVRVEAGAIIIGATEATAYTVCAVDGRLIAAGIAEGEVSVAVSAGVYLVKAGSEAVKIVVK